MAPKLTWPGWENVGLIGKGSFGAVYEIQRNVFGATEKAALKVITIPQSSSDVEDLISDGYDAASIAKRYQDYLEDIVKEYSLMATMKGNSNIVDCDDLHYEKQESGYGWYIYMKMELLTPLTKALDKSIHEDQVIKLGMDICNALVLCRNRSIVHRDIKPQNIFVSADGDYKLGDFGIAKIAEKTTSGTKTGTFKYMAPEVYNNQPYGFAADIYSLGIVLYWMLNERRTPFLPLPPKAPTALAEDEARHKRFSGEPIPPPLYGSNELKRIVCKACAFSPEERYSSAAEMLSDLKALTIDTDATVYEKNQTQDVVNHIKEKSHSKSTKRIGFSEILGGLRGISRSVMKFCATHIYVPILIAAAAVAVAVVAAILLFGNIGNSKEVLTYPTEREMMSDTAEILKEKRISGYVTELTVQNTTENEKYQTYTVECDILVNDNNEKHEYTVVLFYELDGGTWKLSQLSRIK